MEEKIAVASLPEYPKNFSLTTHAPLIKGGGIAPPELRGWGSKNCKRKGFEQSALLIKGVKFHPLN